MSDRETQAQNEQHAKQIENLLKYLSIPLPADVAALEAAILALRGHAALYDALKWLTDIYLGKSHEPQRHATDESTSRPTEGEWIDCIEAAKAALSLPPVASPQTEKAR